MKLNRKRRLASGWTLVEILLAVSILAVLFSLGTVAFGNFIRQDQLLVETREVEAIINEAKIKTLAGFSQGGSSSLNFGVYFSSDRYVFFPGSAYDPENASNQEFVLPETLQITPIFLPGSSVIFEKITGEVLGYDPSQNYLVLDDKKSEYAKRITVNRLGVVRVEDE